MTANTIFLLIFWVTGSPTPLILDAFTTLNACEAVARPMYRPSVSGFAVCQAITPRQ